jgi:hypothetical protein
VLVLSKPGYGQADTGKMFMNTIRINVSNPMIFGWTFNVLGYERVITDHQSASVSFGRTAFPKLSSDSFDSLGISRQYNDHGLNSSIDYRFYLKNENKHRAPRGIYVGPYYAYNSFSRNVNWDINTSSFSGSVDTEIKLGAHLVGAQLGFQFILWKRLAIDMIMMGPGWWYFSLKTKFDSSLPPEDEELLLEKLNEMLKEKFPGSDFTFQGGGFEAKRSSWTSIPGFRYMINLGFRF